MEEKAKRKYGENIELRNIKIGDIKHSLTWPMYGLGYAVGLGVFGIYSESKYDKETEKYTDPKAEICVNLMLPTALLPLLFKFNKSTATVVRASKPYDRNELSLIESPKITAKQEEYEINQRRLEKIKRYHELGFTDREITAIENRKIFIGMSEKALLLSWGNPEHINTSIGSWGTHKQYCYPNSVYIYVENEYITSISY